MDSEHGIIGCRAIKTLGAAIPVSFAFNDEMYDRCTCNFDSILLLELEDQETQDQVVIHSFMLNIIQIRVYIY